MRKAIPFVFLLLFPVIAFGQQQPQWTVVASVAIFNQDHADRHTVTLLTPTEPGIYRLNVYFSGGGGVHNPKGGGFYTELRGFDITGQPLYFTQSFECGSQTWDFMPQVMVSLKPQQSLTYDVGGTPLTPGCIYNLAISVEQLTQ